MNSILFTSSFSTISQAQPTISADELRRSAPSLIGTYRACHPANSASPVSAEEIFRHVFTDNGGCEACKEHYRSLKESVAHLYKLG
jgi:hypothetical protein